MKIRNKAIVLGIVSYADPMLVAGLLGVAGLIAAARTLPHITLGVALVVTFAVLLAWDVLRDKLIDRLDPSPLNDWRLAGWDEEKIANVLGAHYLLDGTPRRTSSMLDQIHADAAHNLNFGGGTEGDLS